MARRGDGVTVRSISVHANTYNSSDFPLLRRRSSQMTPTNRTLLGRQNARTHKDSRLFTAASAQGREKGLGVLEIHGVEAFGEPPVERRQQRAGGVSLPLLLPEATQADGGL
jgi:hypothetical protein